MLGEVSGEVVWCGVVWCEVWCDVMWCEVRLVLTQDEGLRVFPKPE